MFEQFADGGGIVFGLILLVVGIWYVMDSTLGFAMPDADWDQIWPIGLVLLGIGLLYRALTTRESGPTDTGAAASR